MCARRDHSNTEIAISSSLFLSSRFELQIKPICSASCIFPAASLRPADHPPVSLRCPRASRDQCTWHRSIFRLCSSVGIVWKLLLYSAGSDSKSRSSPYLQPVARTVDLGRTPVPHKSCRQERNIPFTCDPTTRKSAYTMASDAPSSSSSQRAHGAPQPTPVPAAGQAASPPTKQSLKSWWKTFRPPARAAPETHGNTPSFRKSCKQLPPLFPETSIERRKLAGSAFKENIRSVHKPGWDGTPGGEDVGPSRASKRFSLLSLAAGAFTAHEQTPRRHSTFLPGAAHGSLRPRRSRSMLHQAPRRQTMNNKRASWQPSTGHVEIPQNAPVPSIVTAKKAKPLLRFFVAFVPRNVKTSTKFAPLVQPPTGIFGVPLRQSITYANVAISLVDAEGRSYIYGYVPIVVAKCGVYLKEKGTW